MEAVREAAHESCWTRALRQGVLVGSLVGVLFVISASGLEILKGEPVSATEFGVAGILCGFIGRYLGILLCPFGRL